MKKNLKIKYLSFLIIFSFIFVLCGCASIMQVNNTVIAKEKSEISKDDQKVISKAENIEVIQNIEENNNLLLNGNLKIHFINVGQADSILIQQGSKSMLIDAGNNGDGKLVKNYLLKEGIKSLDYLIGTHPHEDHIGGLDYIINDFEIGKIYLPKVTSTTKTFKDVVIAIKNRGMKVTVPKTGETFNLGSAKCTIMAPNGSEYKDLNNFSVVIKLEFGSNSFLFTGDAEELSENEILEEGFNVKADLLKVGHHGSSSSTSNKFLSSVNPKYAIISCETGNDYGHPHKKIMDKLKNENIPVYRTDELGTIIATSNGNTITFNTKPGSYKVGSP